MTATFHWQNRPRDTCLTCWRASRRDAHRKTALSIAHLNTHRRLSQALKAMGVAGSCITRSIFRGEASSASAARGRAPRAAAASALRPEAAGRGGTDAHRNGPNPSSRCNDARRQTISGRPMRAPRNCRRGSKRCASILRQRLVQLRTRTCARARSRSARLSRVLSRDYLSVPVEQIGGTVSLLTMVGGRIVHADALRRRLKKNRLSIDYARGRTAHPRAAPTPPAAPSPSALSSPTPRSSNLGVARWMRIRSRCPS